MICRCSQQALISGNSGQVPKASMAQWVACTKQGLSKGLFVRAVVAVSVKQSDLTSLAQAGLGLLDVSALCPLSCISASEHNK